MVLAILCTLEYRVAELFVLHSWIYTYLIRHPGALPMVERGHRNRNRKFSYLGGIERQPTENPGHAHQRLLRKSASKIPIMNYQEENENKSASHNYVVHKQ